MANIVLRLTAKSAKGATVMFDEMMGFDGEPTREAYKNLSCWLGDQDLNKLAKNGYKKALEEDKNFLEGLNIFKGQVTYKAVADVFGHSFVSPADAIK